MPVRPQKKSFSQGFNWIRPGLIQLFLGIFALAIYDALTPYDWWSVGLFLVVSGAALLPFVFRALNRAPEVILADHFFILSCAFFAYYVIGALLLPLGPRAQVEFSISYYMVDAISALRVAAINSIGFGLALVAGALTPVGSFARFGRIATRIGVEIPVDRIILAFFLFGAFSFVYVLQFDLLNFGREAVISGGWRTLSMLLPVAIVLAIGRQGSGFSGMRALAIFMALCQAIAGLLLLNKTQVLIPLVALTMGFALRLGLRRVLLPGLAIVVAVYLLIGGAVTTARNLTTSSATVDWSDRIDLLSSEMFGKSIDTAESDNFSWSRFCYTPAQVAALDFFDAGNGGDDLGKIGWVFLPRIIFPNKPVITAGGREFHFKIRGNMDSSTGQGIFVNGYYNSGFLGLIFFSLGVGVMLAFTSAFALQIFRARAMLWFPLAMLGSYMAFRIDGHFLSDYIGSFVFLLYAVVVMVMLRQFGISRRMA